MAFIKVDKGMMGIRRKGEADVRMGSHLQSDKGTSRGIYVSLSPEVITQVGWKQEPRDEGKRAVCSCMLQEGVGDDAGFFLLVEAAEGYALGRTNKGARAFSMNISMSKLKHYVLNDVPSPSEPVEFTVDEKEHTVLIQCPDWLRYNSLSYTPPPRIPAQQEVRKAPLPPTRAAASEVKQIVKEVAKDTLPHANRRLRRAAVAAVTKSMQ